MTEALRSSLVKPTLQTRFHIDFDWWQKNDRDWHVYLRNYLCAEHQKAFERVSEDILIDWVDPVTAEVHQVDGLQNVLISHCAQQENFITHQTALVDAVFRLFLSNGNNSLTPIELGEFLGRPPYTILKTLAGPRVMQGIRPCMG